MDVRARAGIDIYGTVLRYAEVEQRGPRYQLLRLGSCDFDFDIAEAMLQASPPEHVNLLFLNDTFGGFIDITDASGMNLPDNPMGHAFADYDNDGDQDAFFPNSHEVPTRLYRHDGVDPITGIPTFTDVAVEAGVAALDANWKRTKSAAKRK